MDGVSAGLRICPSSVLMAIEAQLQVFGEGHRPRVVWQRHHWCHLASRQKETTMKLQTPPKKKIYHVNSPKKKKFNSNMDLSQTLEVRRRRRSSPKPVCRCGTRSSWEWCADSRAQGSPAPSTRSARSRCRGRSDGCGAPWESRRTCWGTGRRPFMAGDTQLLQLQVWRCHLICLSNKTCMSVGRFKKKKKSQKHFWTHFEALLLCITWNNIALRIHQGRGHSFHKTPSWQSCSQKGKKK